MEWSPELTQEMLKGFGRSYRMKWHRRVGGGKRKKFKNLELKIIDFIKNY